MLARIIKRLPLVPVIGSGRTRFQLILVEDVANCIARSLEDSSTVNQVIPLGGPEHLAYKEIINLIIQALKVRQFKVHIPIPVMRAIISAMEKLLPQPPVTSAFKPVSLRQGIEDILS